MQHRQVFAESYAHSVVVNNGRVEQNEEEFSVYNPQRGIDRTVWRNLVTGQERVIRRGRPSGLYHRRSPRPTRRPAASPRQLL